MTHDISSSVAATTDRVWRAQDTTPAAMEAAMRGLLLQMHEHNAAYVPGRVLNLICIVDRAYSGEIANRLRHVGRFHPSRTVVCAVEPRRTTLDATVTIATPAQTRPGEVGLARETVIVNCGERHLAHLDGIVDPLVVTDLQTMVWAPHGHDDGVDAVLDLAQVVLRDSVADGDVGEALCRACDLGRRVYVVDLAWLRSAPWRERIAASFDPAVTRADLRLLSRVVVRHHPESTASALLIIGWLASRLGWETSPLVRRDGELRGRAHTRRQDVEIVLEPAGEQQVPGLAGVELESAAGRWLRFDRGPGGLRAHYKHRRGTEREWTVLGASRGEAGILGEGIRQALLRDPTYTPALITAEALLGGRGPVGLS